MSEHENIILVATKGLVLYNKRALIVRRAESDTHGGGIWEFPGGCLEFGETPEECLQREIAEEANLAAEIGSILFTTSLLTHPWRQVIIINFRCTVSTDEVTISREHQAYQWVTKEEMQRLINPAILLDLHRYKIFEKLGDGLL